MAKQYGFYFNAGRCIQCHTCEIACKSTHNIEPGIKWRRVLETWHGEYPKVTVSFLSIACMHCSMPACLAECPTGAISKRIKDGIVAVDKNKCNGCMDCYSACPFDVPQFGNDGIMQKCDFCLEFGKNPVCVSSCPTGALGYGTMEELFELVKTGIARQYKGDTEPSFILKTTIENTVK